MPSLPRNIYDCGVRKRGRPFSATIARKNGRIMLTIMALTRVSPTCSNEPAVCASAGLAATPRARSDEKNIVNGKEWRFSSAKILLGGRKKGKREIQAQDEADDGRKDS